MPTRPSNLKHLPWTILADPLCADKLFLLFKDAEARLLGFDSRLCILLVVSPLDPLLRLSVPLFLRLENGDMTDCVCPQCFCDDQMSLSVLST